MLVDPLLDHTLRTSLVEVTSKKSPHTNTANAPMQLQRIKCCWRIADVRAELLATLKNTRVKCSLGFANVLCWRSSSTSLRKEQNRTTNAETQNVSIWWRGKHQKSDRLNGLLTFSQCSRNVNGPIRMMQPKQRSPFSFNDHCRRSFGCAVSLSPCSKETLMDLPTDVHTSMMKNISTYAVNRHLRDDRMRKQHEITTSLNP
jgi:hypothetical protein